MKKLMAMLLTLSLLFSLALPAMAAETDTATAAAPTTIPAETLASGTEAADTLYSLGLFKGTGTDANGKPIYALNKPLSRNEGVIMLLRLLGKEEEAAQSKCEMPFTDVAKWAAPYVAYAYEHKLTTGLSSTRFGGEDPMPATQYLTFILRAMGYVDNEDFKWNSAWTLTDKLGMTDGTIQEGTFWRAKVAEVSLSALSTVQKDGTILGKKLVEAGVFTQEQAEEAGILSKPGTQVPVLVHNGECTGIDPQRPNGNAPVMSLEEAFRDYVTEAQEIILRDSDEGLQQPYIKHYDSNGGSDEFVEFSKYVQVSDDIVGILTSSGSKSDTWGTVDREITLDIAMYVGDSITIDRKDIVGLTGSRKWRTWDEDGFTATVNGSVWTLKASQMNWTYYDMQGNGLYLVAWLMAGDGEDLAEPRYNTDFTVRSHLYAKRPDDFSKVDFRVDTDGERILLADEQTLGKTWVSGWVMPKGMKLDEADTSTLAYDQDFGRIRIFPSAHTPSALLTDEGYLDQAKVRHRYTIELCTSKPDTSWVEVSENGRIEVIGLDWRTRPSVTTIKVTSRYDGTSVLLDVGIMFAPK